MIWVPVSIPPSICAIGDVSTFTAGTVLRGSMPFTAAVNGMEPRNTVPAVNVDTSPIAQMLGGMDTGTQIIQYITVQGGDNLNDVGNELAQSIKQYLRTI